jgi:hypothetical protein
MFVVSFKSSTLKVFGVLFALGIVVAAAAWQFGAQSNVGASAAVSSSVTSKDSVVCSTNEQRVSFLKSLGWQVDEEPCEIAEIVIPQVFNSVYNNYNSLQKSQGYDLSKYKGVRAKRWTYNIKNYPDKKGVVHANLLVYNNSLIGGDIASVAIDGFMVGLKNQSTGFSATPHNSDIVKDAFTKTIS